jgi:hypothetical protein
LTEIQALAANQMAAARIANSDAKSAILPKVLHVAFGFAIPVTYAGR